MEMKTFTITIKAKSEGDAEMALEEVARLIGQGNTSGFNSNETGSFDFDSDGEFDEDEIEEETA